MGKVDENFVGYISLTGGNGLRSFGTVHMHGRRDIIFAGTFL